MNLFAFEQALKITWIRGMLQDDIKWQRFIKIQNIYEHRIFLWLRLYKNIITNLKNEFWKDVLKALFKLQTVLEVDNGKGKADHIPIFYNEFLHIANEKNIITNLKNEFWKDVLKALFKLQTVLEVDNGKGKADHIPIFYNEFLHIANEGFIYKSGLIMV